MRARILGIAAALCLLPVAAWAQDGLRSASLPERPLISRPSPARGDLFRADPDTYAPGRHRRSIYELPIVVLPGYWPLGDVYYMSPPPYGNVPCAGVVRGCPVSFYDYSNRRDRRHAHRHGGGSDPPTRHDSWGLTPPPPPTPAPPPPAAAPGVPKTFYVIAGCYAGDKPPQPEWLPPDCDLARVRVIPP